MHWHERDRKSTRKSDPPLVFAARGELCRLCLNLKRSEFPWKWKQEKKAKG